MGSDANQLTSKHAQLTHSEEMRVASHVQRNSGDWILNTLMIDGCDVPFKYKRKRLYKSLVGQRVNLTYYRETEKIAGFELEVMTVVPIKRS